MNHFDAGGPRGVLEIHAVADPAELSSVRTQVRQFVEGAGGGTDLAGDLELVVSELATNVIEHTGSPTLTVVLARTIADWLVEVSDVADLGILDDVALPDVSQPAGRGLFVVRSIVDEMSIVEAGDAYAIRCRIAVA
jgi:anti-sigma regulatory factor (Ser/Thr protein kinase)